MRVLLLYPLFPKTFWSFADSVKTFLPQKRAMYPPLGLITVAALLPQEWDFKLVDRNVREVTEEEWNWAEFVMISAMNVQEKDFRILIQEAKQRNKPVCVGGPYPTSYFSEVQEMGADYLVLDEGEMTIPLFLEALERGESNGIFRHSEKPDIHQTPLPRYDLVELEAYLEISLQFSRGCPFLCEFCDIIQLYGRKHRTKSPPQVLRELDYLYDLGWRGDVMIVDDNFIGSKTNVKRILRAVKGWMSAKKYPFFLYTEASVNLAKDPEMMTLMTDCNFAMVFLGVETPDEESLLLTQKKQNLHTPLLESIETIQKAGLMTTAGMIMGFDGERKGAGERVVQFIEASSIPLALFTILQALPNTDLWNRLKKEGRLTNQLGDINQTTLMNFVPTRPMEDIAHEYIDAFWQLYDPEKYMGRSFRLAMKLGRSDKGKSFDISGDTKGAKALLRLLWREGVIRKTRGVFWNYFFRIIFKKPTAILPFVLHCAAIEHFQKYRQIVKEQILSLLEAHQKAQDLEQSISAQQMVNE